MTRDAVAEAVREAGSPDALEPFIRSGSLPRWILICHNVTGAAVSEAIVDTLVDLGSAAPLVAFFGNPRAGEGWKQAVLERLTDHLIDSRAQEAVETLNVLLTANDEWAAPWTEIMEPHLSEDALPRLSAWHAAAAIPLFCGWTSNLPPTRLARFLQTFPGSVAVFRATCSHPSADRRVWRVGARTVLHDPDDAIARTGILEEVGALDEASVRRILSASKDPMVRVHLVPHARGDELRELFTGLVSEVEPSDLLDAFAAIPASVRPDLDGDQLAPLLQSDVRQIRERAITLLGGPRTR